MGREGQRSIGAWLSEDSWHAWQDFADEHGVDITDLLEACGHRMAESLQAGRMLAGMADLVKRAREHRATKRGGRHRR